MTQIDRLRWQRRVAMAFDEEVDFCPDDLPCGWNSNRALFYLHDIGNTWVAEAETPIVAVPSVVAQQEFNHPINPAGQIKRKIAEIDRKAMRLADLVAQTSAPNALLRQIETLETEREELARALARFQSDEGVARALRTIHAGDVRRMMAGILEDLQAGDPAALKDALTQIIEKVELSPDSFDATVTYRIAPGMKTGEQVASPRGFEPRLPP